jgi:hypothetical protein
MFAGVAGCVFLSVLIGRSLVLEYVGRHSIVFYALNALMLNAAKLMVFRDPAHQRCGAACGWKVGVRRARYGSRHAPHGYDRSVLTALDVVVDRRGKSGGEASARGACAVNMTFIDGGAVIC